jgi:rubrerythrin
MKDGKVWWKCMVCGYVYESAKALENCPVCLHPQSYMKLKEEDY